MGQEVNLLVTATLFQISFTVARHSALISHYRCAHKFGAAQNGNQIDSELLSMCGANRVIITPDSRQLSCEKGLLSYKGVVFISHISFFCENVGKEDQRSRV